MHESSYNEMKAFADKYLDPDRELQILDVGSLNVNGTYKSCFNNPKWDYKGLDLMAGPNIDIVSDNPYSYPLRDHSVDVVIAGSTMEHVEDLHAFVKEIARILKPDGIVCIIAPWTYPEHKYPIDCWRIMPDGMAFLLGKIAGLPVLDVHKNETDCIGVAGTWGKRLKISFGVLVNDLMRLDMVFRQSEIDPATPCHTIKLPDSATKGLNKLLGIMEDEGADIAILSHQDMYFRQGWLPQVERQIAQLPDSWVAAGIIGKDFEGKITGRFHDMRIPANFDTGHTYPVPACCFDECVIIVNLKKGFRFDEALEGFDLYGTLCCLQTEEMGGTPWIIDAYAEHYCMRPFHWFPDQQFQDNFKWLHERFPNALRIDTTVLGTPESKETKQEVRQWQA